MNFSLDQACLMTKVVITKEGVKSQQAMCQDHKYVITKEAYPAETVTVRERKSPRPWWWILGSDGSSLGDAIVGSMSSEVLVVVSHFLLGIVPPPTVLRLEFLPDKLQVSWGLRFS